MARKGTLGRVIVLLLLIIVLVFIGLWWFDYLGIIRARDTFAPFYELVGIQPKTTISTETLVAADLDEDRYTRRLEALDVRSKELDQRELALNEKTLLIEQRLQELEEKQIALDEREKTFNQTVNQYDNESKNVEQSARYLTGMPPQKAVDILLNMDDQDVIDRFRMVEDIARREGSSSMVSYWLSLMPAERAATLQRKMAIKPVQTQ